LEGSIDAQTAVAADLDALTTTTKVQANSSKDGERHFIKSMDDERRVKMKEAAGDLRNAQHRPLETHIRRSTFALATEPSRTKRNISTILTEMPEPHNTGTKARKQGTDLANVKNIWYEIQLTKQMSMPSDYVAGIPVVDPLSKKFDTSSLRRITYQPQVKYLGVLLDAGRHYFHLDWIHRMIDVLAVLNYNLLHFRLTDDQAFNVLLNSQPSLAYPSIIHNNTRVYTPQELKQVVQYAASKGI
jgi:hypothetical protein